MNHRYQSLVAAHPEFREQPKARKSVWPAVAVIGGGVALVFGILPWVNNTSARRQWNTIQAEMKAEAEEEAAAAEAARELVVVTEGAK